MFKELWSNIFKPNMRPSQLETPAANTAVTGGAGARLHQSNGRFIVIDENNKPLTQWYDAETFSYTVDTAKSVQRMAKATGREPDPAVEVIANYSPSAPTS